MTLPKNDKEWYDYLQRRGIIAPENEGFVTETLQGAGNAALNFGQSIGSTVEELGGGTGIKDYFKRKEAAHQNWEPDENYSAMSLNPGNIGRTLGSGVTQSAAAVGTGIVTTAATGGNAIAGLTAAGAVTFGQIYGDTVKDYRAALPNEDESTVKGLAFVSAAGQSLLETVLGPEKMAAGITKKICTDALKETTLSMSKKMGAGFIKQAVSEGSEEVAQDFWNRLTLAVGKEQGVELPSWNEVGEQFFGGAIPGGFMGGIGGAVEHKAAKLQQQARHDLNNNSPVIPDSSSIQPIPQMTPEDMAKVTPNAMPEDNAKSDGVLTQINEENKQALVNTSLVDSVAKELGLKVNYIDEAANGNEIKNGHYDEKTGAIFINRNQAARDPMETLGHEFKHFLNQRHADLVQSFDELFDKGLNKEGQEAVQKTQELYGERGDAKAEVNANTFAQFWNDPDFWKDVATRAEAKQPGMGQKFITALDEFIKMLRMKLKDIGTPEAKVLFDNLGELRASAVESLAEYKKKQEAVKDVINGISQESVKDILNGIKQDADNGIKTEVPKVEETPVVKENLTTQTETPVKASGTWNESNSLNLNGNSTDLQITDETETEKGKKETGDRVRSVRASGVQFNDSLIPKDGSPDSGYKDIIIDKSENAKKLSISSSENENKVAVKSHPEKKMTLEEIAKDNSIEPRDIILSPDGNEYWGIIPKEIEKETKGIVESLPIVLKKGRHDTRTNKGFGITHILERHEAELKRLGWGTSEFIQRIIKECNSIAVQDNGRLVLLKYGKPNSYMSIELRNNEDFYSIVTAFTDDNKGNVEKGTEVWHRRTADNAQPRTATARPGLLHSEQETLHSPLEGHTRQTSEDIIKPEDGKVNTDNKKLSISRPRKQVNPVIEDGNVKDEYQDLLENGKYEPEQVKEWADKAQSWILRMGGIENAAKAIADGLEVKDNHIATIARRLIINSEEFKAMPEKERAAVEVANMEAGTSWGREGVARRLDAIKLDTYAKAQAFFNKMSEKLKEKDFMDLRNKVLDKTGVDVSKLPPDIQKDQKKLDEVIREAYAASADFWSDKLHEFWINSILSAPTTHIANTIGNTANAVYELGFKRFTEALINMIAKRKDAATFGEFKEMTKAFDWKTAFLNAKRSFDLEATTSGGKIETQIRTAIGGKWGRAVRYPGRILRAADEFAKSIINPVESTAWAYREAVNKGLQGDELSNYIREQLAKPNSKARKYGEQQALDMTFQEDPGGAIEWLMELRERGGITGTVLKYFLPFIKTPANILTQSVRKSPIGVVNLAWQTGKGLTGKREFDNEYIQHAAEQLLVWGVTAAFMGMIDWDDDELPILTGSSAKYGSAEQKFKANKVPPYSIKIGDNYYSYKRIEPLATGLAFMADGIQALKDARNGRDGTEIIKKLIGGTAKQLVVEKSYLDSIGEIYKVMSEPEGNLAKVGTNFISSWMPNVVRSTMNLYDDNVSDNKSRSKGVEFWEDQFWITTNRMGITKASPKLDYFGREITKDSLADAGPLWPLMRMVPIQSVSPDDNMDKAEQLIWNYNQTAEEAWYPDVPAYYFEKGSKKYYFTRDDYQDYARESGELAHKQIMNAINAGYLNVNKPTEKDIEAMKKIFNQARKSVKDKMFQQKRYSE